MGRGGAGSMRTRMGSSVMPGGGAIRSSNGGFVASALAEYLFSLRASAPNIWSNSTGQCIQSIAMSSRAKSRDLTNAENVTQVGEILRSEPDWHTAQDDNALGA